MPITIDPALKGLPPDDQGFPNADLGSHNSPALDEYLDALPYHGFRPVIVVGVPLTIREAAAGMRVLGQVPVATGSSDHGESEVELYPSSMLAFLFEGLLGFEPPPTAPLQHPAGFHLPIPSLLDQVIHVLGLRHASREDIPRLAVLEKRDLIRDRSMSSVYLYRDHICLVELTRGHELILIRFDGAFEKIDEAQFREDLARLGDIGAAPRSIGVTVVDFSHNSITGGRERITAHFEGGEWDLEYDVPFEPIPLLEWLVSVRNNAAEIVDLIRILRHSSMTTEEEAERGVALIDEHFREPRWEIPDELFQEIRSARVSLLGRPESIRQEQEAARQAVSQRLHTGGTSGGNPKIHQGWEHSFHRAHAIHHHGPSFQSMHPALYGGGMAFAGADVLAASDVVAMMGE